MDLSTHRTVDVAGVERRYLLRAPSTYADTQSWPLIVSYHGYHGNARSQRSLDSLDVVAGDAGFFVAYPEGLVVSNPRDTSGTGWNVDGSLGDHDDFRFTKALIQDIRRDFAIDTSRIHVTGFSMGSRMAFGVACRMADVVASVAGVAGPMDEAAIDNCAPDRPVSALLVMGTEDPAFPVEGTTVGRFVFGHPARTVALWARLGACDPAPVERPVTDADPWDGTTVTRMDYQGCRANTTVTHYRINRGGHVWPSGPDLGSEYGRWNRDLKASEAVARFFARTARPPPDSMLEIEYQATPAVSGVSS